MLVATTWCTTEQDKKAKSRRGKYYVRDKKMIGDSGQDVIMFSLSVL